MIPLNIAFQYDFYDDLRTVELIFDFFLLIDMIVSMFTCYYKDVELVTRLRPVLWHNIKWYLIPDFLGCVPGLIVWESSNGIYPLKIIRFFWIFLWGMLIVPRR